MTSTLLSQRKHSVADMEAFAYWLKSSVTVDQWNRWVLNYEEHEGIQ